MWSNKDMYQSKTWSYAYFFPICFCNVGRPSWRRFVVSIVLYITRLFFSSGSCSWWSCRPRSVKSFDGKVQSSKAVGTYRAASGSSLFCKVDGCPRLIDLFTDTAAILNYLDLRSIMGCPGAGLGVWARSDILAQYLNALFGPIFR